VATTAVQDRLELDLTELKTLLGISASDDSCDQYLALTLRAAKSAADTYLNNPFQQVDTDLTADDYVNWPGNFTGGSIQGAEPAIDPDQDTGSGRLSHSIPDLYTDPAVDLPIPDDVKIGVVEWCRVFVSGKPADVLRERIGDWQVDYAVFVSKPDRTVFVSETFWKMHRLIPGM